VITFNKKKKYAKKYYELLNMVYKEYLDYFETSKELQELFKNKNKLENEFIIILLFFTTRRIYDYIPNSKLSQKILNEIHNLYYNDLKVNYKKSHEELQEICSILNYRYKYYAESYNDTKNLLFTLSRKFIKNFTDDEEKIKDLLVIMSISSWFVKINEQLNKIILMLNDEVGFSKVS
jgi:hypothetical protein